MKRSRSSHSLSYVVLFAIVGAAFGLFINHSRTVSGQKRSLDEKNDQQVQILQPALEGAEYDAPEAVVSGTLTLADPTFNRPVTCGALSGVGTAVHFDAIPFTVSTGGTVTISLEAADGGSITPSGSAGQGPDTFFVLYGPGGFNSASPLTNCVAISDDIASAANRRSRISQSLAAGSYTIVMTSFDNTPTASTNNDPLPWTYNLAINVPTAAGVGVSGRVLTSAGGRGLVGARVTLTDQNGSTRSVITGRGGRYMFDDLEPGQTYIVNVLSRRFSFQPQVIQMNDNITELNFVPE